MRHDLLQKAISENQEAVIYALDATEVVQESMERIGSWPPATKHLGQAMMAAILLQALQDIEENETLSMQWMCAGPFGHVYADARNFGQVRGTIQHPRSDVKDYETTLGEGVLQVRRAKGSFGTTSIVNSTGEVSLDVVEYLEKSEQKNCGVNLSVHIEWDETPDSSLKFRVRSALGYLIHIMPQPTEQKLNDALLRWDRQMRSLGPISRWVLRENEVTTDMIRLISGEENPNLVMNQRVQFSCNCSEDRAARALAILETQEESEGQYLQQEVTDIRCEYCGREYSVSAARTDELKGSTEKKAKKRRFSASPQSSKKKGKSK